MRYEKVTLGCVSQIYDTELGHFVSQEFKAWDEEAYRNDKGKPSREAENLFQKHYLPYTMVQPGDGLEEGFSISSEDK